MNLIGKATINPWLFYTGKMSGYLTWILFVLSIINSCLSTNTFNILFCISIIIFIVGLIITVISLFNLGKSTTLGIPAQKTEFKTSELYKISRNPMYLGFNFLTLGSMVYIHSVLVIILGIYSLIIYHFIILGEEKFMEKTFGQKYLIYKTKVRRYL